MSHNLNSNTTDCLIIHGGGITGFWNILGKLKKVDFKNFSKIYCYSSGCLALIIKQNKYENINNIINKTIELKKEVYKNYSNFYNLRSNFINFLIDDYHKANSNNSFSIISSNRYGRCIVNKYSLNILNKTNIKEVMLDSSYIPMITGYLNEHRKAYDGAFCHLDFPNCKYNIHPDINLFNFKNILNFDLSLAQIHKLLNNN